MNRINFPATAEEAPAATQGILDGLRKTLGFIPNLHRLMSISPPVLTGWFGLMSNLGKTLDVKTRDSIALATGEANGCDYCLAAHSYVAATFANMSAAEIALNRAGHSESPKRAAAAAFAQRVIEMRGRVSDEDIATVRAAGYSDANIIEIVALTAQFLMTNFLNNVAGTEIDFPATEISAVAA
ncbi:MAG TPA: carboxymuconolactone decarboxylase family protein [Acidobacteriaceae bacterium]|nr:carboxymuconolactone decarboxylase family protein [Acidobacteriaceae bacterium]